MPFASIELRTFLLQKVDNWMSRDIDYAATAVRTAIVDKFGRKDELRSLDVTANERTISIRDKRRSAEGTRDDLLAAIRAADTYAQLWDSLAMHGKSIVTNEDVEE